MKYIFFTLFFGIFISSTLLGQDGLNEKRVKCFDYLQEEMREILQNDPEFIQLQATITALKLSKEILARKNLKSQSLESYLENIVGPRSKEYMQKNEEKLLALYQKYATGVSPMNR